LMNKSIWAKRLISTKRLSSSRVWGWTETQHRLGLLMGSNSTATLPPRPAYKFKLARRCRESFLLNPRVWGLDLSNLGCFQLHFDSACAAGLRAGGASVSS
jgi:hypothetical protein